MLINELQSIVHNHSVKYRKEPILLLVGSELHAAILQEVDDSGAKQAKRLFTLLGLNVARRTRLPQWGYITYDLQGNKLIGRSAQYAHSPHA